MPGVSNGRVSGKDSTPNILTHYDVIKMWRARDGWNSNFSVFSVFRLSKTTLHKKKKR